MDYRISLPRRDPTETRRHRGRVGPAKQRRPGGDRQMSLGGIVLSDV